MTGETPVPLAPILIEEAQGRRRDDDSPGNANHDANCC
jgi:hypothetical protein